MKSLIYNYPLTFGTLINIISFLLNVYVYTFKSEYIGLSILFMVWVGTANKDLIDNGHNMNKKRKRLLLGIIVMFYIIFTIYVSYVSKIRVDNIMNGSI